MDEEFSFQEKRARCSTLCPQNSKDRDDRIYNLFFVPEL